MTNIDLSDPYEAGRRELGHLVNSPTVGSNANEATTRLQLIDALLFGCMGWYKSDVVSEERHNGTYTDYSIGKPSTQLIVEAKREGVHFNVPPGLSGRRSLTLQTLLKERQTAAALKQVLQYCQERGVPIGVLCNGHQIIAFFASRQDGIPPLDGHALVFSSLQEMYDDFAVLWNHLSKPGIATRNLQRALLGRTPQAQPPEKLSSQIRGYPGFRARTAMETDLKVLGQLFIQDLENGDEVDIQFITSCYSRSGALSQYALVSREILRARYAAIKEVTPAIVEPARERKELNPRLTSEGIASALSRRPIVLLGDVGVGKSMFLRHLLKVEARDVLGRSLILYINFAREPALATDLGKYIANRMQAQLLVDHELDVEDGSFVRAVYNRELNRFRRGLDGELQESNPDEYKRRELELLRTLVSDESEHLRRSLEHIKATSDRSPLMVLDNIDQRPQQFQEEVFAIAHSLADSWPGVVFVALRPSTFYSSQTHGSLAAYQLRVFTISPARTEDVIVRRLDFARDLAVESGESRSFPGELTLEATEVAAYLDALVEAFKNDQQLKELIDNLSGGNLRIALMFLYTFIGSGYVSTQRVLDIAEAGDVYHVPMHEFLRAIMFGEHDYFDPKASVICNIFDISIDDGREHFLLPCILAHAQRSGEGAGRGGFVSTASIYEFGQSAGFTQEQVGAQLGRALDKHLLEPKIGNDSDDVRITSVGAYMYRKMAHLFSYVDAMIVDTPITQFTARKKIGDSRAILDRLDRATIFRQYLDEQWLKLGSLGFEPPFKWNEVSQLLDADIQRVRGLAERAIARRKDDAV